MDLLTGFNLNKLPKTEESGECCIRKIQEFMVHDVSRSVSPSREQAAEVSSWGMSIFTIIVCTLQRLEFPVF